MSDKRVIAISAIVLVAVVMGMSFGIAQAMQDKVKVSFGLDILQTGNDVTVIVKAKGLESNEDFAMRAYTVTDCGSGPPLLKVGPVLTNSNGNLVISGKISPEAIGDVNSVSIRDDTGNAIGPIVVCFQNTTP